MWKEKELIRKFSNTHLDRKILSFLRINTGASIESNTYHNFPMNGG